MYGLFFVNNGCCCEVSFDVSFWMKSSLSLAILLIWNFAVAEMGQIVAAGYIIAVVDIYSIVYYCTVVVYFVCCHCY